MKKNVKRMLTVMAAAVVMCMNFEVLATSVPKKTESAGTQSKYESDTQKVIQTVKESETENKTEQEAQNTPKATAKATQKATATAKATAKATQKTTATAKATQKTTQKTTQKSSTVATIAPEDDVIDVEGTDTIEDNVIIVEDENPEPKLNVVTNPEQINAKRYLTKGGAFGMFILTVLVSAVLSFLISYRFYKMNRTDSHLMAEIRALRRDIDTKMAGSVGGFSGYETKTSNTNPSYARDGQPIRRNTQNAEEKTSGDMYSKWERQINTQSSAVRNREENAEREQRSEAYIARRSRSKKQKSAADKIKDAFSDIFSKRK